MESKEAGVRWIVERWIQMSKKRIIIGMLCYLIFNSSGISLVAAAPGESYNTLQEQTRGIVNDLKRENSTADFSTMDATLLSLNITLGAASSNDRGASLLAALTAVNTAEVDIEQGMNKIIDQVGTAYGSNNGLGSQDNRGQTSVKVLKERLTANLNVMKEQAKQAKQVLALKLKALLEGTSEDGGQPIPLSPQEREAILKEWAQADPQSLSGMSKEFSPEVALVAQETLKKATLSGPMGKYSLASWGQWNDKAIRVLEYGDNRYRRQDTDESALINILTTVSNIGMPTTGTATYDGAVVASVDDGSLISSKYIGTKTGAHLLTVDFAGRSVNGGFELNKIGIGDPPYTVNLNGSIAPGSNALNGTIIGGGITDGKFTGGFYVGSHVIGASFTGSVDGGGLQGTIIATKN